MEGTLFRGRRVASAEAQGMLSAFSAFTRYQIQYIYDV